MEAPKAGGGRSWTGRQIAVLVGVVIVVAAISGVAVYYATPRSAPGLTVIGPWAGSEEALFRPVLQNFTKDTGIQVTYQVSRQEDLRLVLPSQFAARRSPGDVIFMISSAIQEYAKEGHALDVTSLVDKGAYGQGALDPVTVDGKVFGGVYTGKVKPGFWYRKSFFAEHNLQPPTTWSDFVSLLWTIKNITKAPPIASGDGVGWPLSDVTEHFIATYGGAEMHQRLAHLQLSWTDDSVKAVFSQRLVPLLQAGMFTEPQAWDTTALGHWWNGTDPLYFMGSWITGMVKDPSDLGVFPLPPVQGVTPGVVFAADYFFIPKYASNMDAAKRLFQYLAGAQGQTVQVRQGGHIATALGVPLDAYPAVDKQVAQLLTGKVVLTDLDDTIGGDFQTNFWTQLQNLWVNPGQWPTILQNIQGKVPTSGG